MYLIFFFQFHLETKVAPKISFKLKYKIVCEIKWSSIDFLGYWHRFMSKTDQDFSILIVSCFSNVTGLIVKLQHGPSIQEQVPNSEISGFPTCTECRTEQVFLRIWFDGFVHNQPIFSIESTYPSWLLSDQKDEICRMDLGSLPPSVFGQPGDLCQH